MTKTELKTLLDGMYTHWELSTSEFITNKALDRFSGEVYGSEVPRTVKQYVLLGMAVTDGLWRRERRVAVNVTRPEDTEEGVVAENEWYLSDI